MWEALARSAGPDGFLPFDRFMEIALYAPQVGYYEQSDSPIGVAGDFYTAPQLHPIFGETVGRHVTDVLVGLLPSENLRIVELGPGNGELAASIITEVARSLRKGPPIDYVLVERSRRRAQTALSRSRLAAEGSRLRPRTWARLGDGGPFEGVVVAHEFWDAQPVRRFRWAGNAWEELGVRLESGHLTEAARPLPPGDQRNELPPAVDEGSVVEVAPRVEGSLREVADHLHRGRAHFIDIGDEEAELLRAHRFGTLTAIRDHQVLEHTTEGPGEVDLSTHVNFSRVRAAAKRSGLETVSDLTQAEALVAWGIAEVKAGWEARAPAGSEAALRTHLAVKNLLFGFSRFRALEFGPGPWTPT